MIAALALALAVLPCSGADLQPRVNVVPQPLKVSLHKGRVALNENNTKWIQDTSLAAESYAIAADRSGVQIRYADANGRLYAGYTLEQLKDSRGRIPCVQIEDSPRFGYRGMHLDCSRHFFSVQEVKKYIDIISFHKCNTLHWHLTDDQGWRIEVQKYPRLTEVSAFRDRTIIRKGPDFDETRYGGFYTREQIRDVVAYAAQKGINIIPEVDLPGHMVAVLAAYPELGCTGGPYKVWDRWGIADDVLCAGNEQIYTFLEDVLEEVMELFPSKFIHIGGDECPKTRWHDCPKCQAKIKELGITGDGKFSAEDYLQSYVMTRIEKFINAHGRRVIGWDEILEGNPTKSAVVMSWRGNEGGKAGRERGMDVIMTPHQSLYFDYYQSSDRDAEPFAIGGYIPVDKVYEYEPLADALGVQANLWTEYIATPQHLEYMLLPRLAALSEVQWCAPERKDYAGFLGAMSNMRGIYERNGWNYAGHIFAPGYTYGAPKPVVHKGVGKPAKALTQPHPVYTFGAPAELFDGLFGDGNFRSGAWLGYRDAPMDIVLQMDRTKVGGVTMTCLIDKGAYIFAPVRFSVEVSDDGQNYTEISSDQYDVDGVTANDGIRTYSLTFKPLRAKYLRIKAQNLTSLPQWHPGAGRPAFMFVDELVIR